MTSHSTRLTSLRYSHWVLAVLWLATALVPSSAMAEGASRDSTSSPADAVTVERRLSRITGFLADDQLAGRGLGTPELQVAADFIEQRFRELGLEVQRQSFRFTRQAQPSPNNRAAVVHRPSGERMDWKVNQQYRPLAIGSAGNVDAPLVFAGFGITAPEANYDDYAELDVEGKVVVVLRHEPRQADPHSPFNGTDHSEHAPFRRKVQNAIDHGAAAILFCTDMPEIERQAADWRRRRDAAREELAAEQRQFESHDDPTDEQQLEHRRRSRQWQERIERYSERLAGAADALLPFEGAGAATSDERIPVLFASRSTIDALLARADRPSLESLEAEIDRQLAPQSFALDDWRLVANVDIERDELEIDNVVAVLDAAGPKADETLIVGAHYDHLGMGGMGSAAPGERAVHNGADDNASGVAVLLEVARRMASRSDPPERRVVFIAFTGEERGLLGSAHYAEQPLFPLESTIAMLNFDMVGRMDDNRLIVNGVDTGKQFAAWVEQVNRQHGFDLRPMPGGLGPSDHASFYSRQVPVLHFFTGMHDDYHRPSDDLQLLNMAGMRRVADYVSDLAELLLTDPDRPTYVESAAAAPSDAPRDPRPYFGSIPDFARAGPGYAISGVAPGSPAADAGLERGDRIVRLADIHINSLEDFDRGLRQFAGGDEVRVVVLRDGEELSFDVLLAPPRN